MEILQPLKVKTKEIEAGGGVVFRISSEGKTEVLLIFRNSVWDLPKGKRGKNETRRECAAREVMEEVGSGELPLIVKELVTTKHSYMQKRKKYVKITYWYSMQFEEDRIFVPQTSEGIEKVEWKQLETAISKVGYENLVSVLENFEQKLPKIKKA